MSVNKNIVMHFKGQEEFVSRMLDLDERANRIRNIVFTPFLNESERDIVYRLPLSCNVYEEGGYSNAELKKLAFVYDSCEVIFPIVFLKACYDLKFHTLNHSDVLGAFMNLGLNKEVIGDILVRDGCLYLVVEEAMSDYVIMNLTQIKRCSIQFEECEYIPEKQTNILYNEMIISSFRLDVIVSAITHLSRDKAKILIRGGHVKINQVVLEEYDFLCNNNSTISIRRFGRFTLENCQRKTKKNRHVIRIGKYV